MGTFTNSALPDLFVKYFFEKLTSYYINTLYVCNVIKEPISHKIESDLDISHCFGELPWEFGIYRLFVRKENKNDLINAIKKEIPSFNIRKNISTSRLLDAIPQT